MNIKLFQTYRKSYKTKTYVKSDLVFIDLDKFTDGGVKEEATGYDRKMNISLGSMEEAVYYTIEVQDFLTHLDLLKDYEYLLKEQYET